MQGKYLARTTSGRVPCRVRKKKKKEKEILAKGKVTYSFMENKAMSSTSCTKVENIVQPFLKSEDRCQLFSLQYNCQST